MFIIKGDMADWTYMTKWPKYGLRDSKPYFQFFTSTHNSLTIVPIWIKLSLSKWAKTGL